jgi:glycosyltransferase involved in cell wall biosynthesis
MQKNNKKNNPFFSIIIPTYNHGHLIRKCIDSIIVQTFSNWEALIINNFSPDNTIQVIESYKDSRIKLINFSNNGIIAASRNTGIRTSNGEWICFLDSDDYWCLNKLEIVYQFVVNNPNVDLVCHDLLINYIKTGKKKLLYCGPVVPDLYCDLLKYGNRFPNSAISIKKSTLEKFSILVNENKNLISVEDYDLSLQLAVRNALFACIHIPLGEYSVDTNNISGAVIHHENLEFLLRKHVFEIQTFEPDKSKLWRVVSSRLNIIKGVASFKVNKYIDSMHYFLLALKLSKRNFFKYLYGRLGLSLRRIRVP